MELDILSVQHTPLPQNAGEHSVACASYTTRGDLATSPKLPIKYQPTRSSGSGISLRSHILISASTTKISCIGLPQQLFRKHDYLSAFREPFLASIPLCDHNVLILLG